MPLDPRSVLPNGSHDQPTPLWRQHYPVDADADTSQSRRSFLGGLTVASGAMVCGQVAIDQVMPGTSSNSDMVAHAPRLLPKKLREMAPGETQAFHYPDERTPCLLVKLSDDEFVAFAQKCTHLACPVIPELDQQRFHCPCHHGEFDLRTGEPKSGPPREALRRVRVELAADGTLTATGIS